MLYKKRCPSALVSFYCSDGLLIGSHCSETIGAVADLTIRQAQAVWVHNPPIHMDNFRFQRFVWTICLVSQMVRTVNRREKREGFPGQHIVVLPRSVVERALEQPLTSGLLPTDVGYFPHAHGHLRERRGGVNQAIFIYCAKGAGWCELGGCRHNVQAGELLVVPPDAPHVYGADEACPWTIYWFHVRGALVDRFLGELDVAVDRPVIRLGEEMQLLALFGEVLDLVEHGYGSLQLVQASHALGHLLAIMVRDRRNAHREQPTSQQRIVQTIQFMKEHLYEPVQLDTLASVANLSRSQFVALFRQQTGYAPIDYFIRLRMHRACQMLDTTTISVKEVAMALGYEDPLYFSRLFRQVNEVSPKEYRGRRKG